MSKKSKLYVKQWRELKALPALQRVDRILSPKIATAPLHQEAEELEKAVKEQDGRIATKDQTAITFYKANHSRIQEMKEFGLPTDYKTVADVAHMEAATVWPEKEELLAVKDDTNLHQKECSVCNFLWDQPQDESIAKDIYFYNDSGEPIGFSIAAITNGAVSPPKGTGEYIPFHTTEHHRDVYSIMMNLLPSHEERELMNEIMTQHHRFALIPTEDLEENLATLEIPHNNIFYNAEEDTCIEPMVTWNKPVIHTLAQGEEIATYTHSYRNLVENFSNKALASYIKSDNSTTKPAYNTIRDAYLHREADLVTVKSSERIFPQPTNVGIEYVTSRPSLECNSDSVLEDTSRLQKFTEDDIDSLLNDEDNSFLAKDMGFPQATHTTRDKTYNSYNSPSLTDEERFEAGYQSYDDYKHNLTRTHPQGSITPEFCISNHMEFYVNEASGNFRHRNNLEFGLEGAVNSQTLYNDSAKMRLGEKLTSHDELQQKNKVFTLRCKVAKKLLPYYGFFPLERATQVAGLFAKGYQEHISSASYMQALLQPFFAPGILFNSMKSGISVDWAAYKHRRGMANESDMYDSYSDEEEYDNYLSLPPNHRLPFTSLLNPKFHVGEDYYLLYPSHYPRVDTPISIPSFNWKGNNDILYQLAMHNLLAEIPKFFLQKQRFLTFASKDESLFKTMLEGKTYYMDVVLHRSSGFNNTGDAYQYGPRLEANDHASEGGHVAYAPPYFSGDSVARLSFTPYAGSRRYTLDEIFSHLQIEYMNYNNAGIFNKDEGNFDWEIVREEDYRDTLGYKNMMNIDSSVELNARTKKLNVDFNLDGVPIRVNESKNYVWVITPFFECPTLSGDSNHEPWNMKGITPNNANEGVHLTLRDSDDAPRLMDVYSMAKGAGIQIKRDEKITPIGYTEYQYVAPSSTTQPVTQPTTGTATPYYQPIAVGGKQITVQEEQKTAVVLQKLASMPVTAASTEKAKKQYFNTQAAKNETYAQASNRAIWNPR